MQDSLTHSKSDLNFTASAISSKSRRKDFMKSQPVLSKPTRDAAVVSHRKRLDRQPPIMLAVDVETHDWRDGNPPLHVGRYGHLSFVSAKSLKYSRIVQFGWVIFRVINKGVQVQEKFQACVSDLPVKISAKATDFHHLTNEDLQKGQMLKTLLTRFGTACETVERTGGRMLAQHLEFDAGLIAAELQRARMPRVLKLVERMARKGVCTYELIKAIFPRRRYMGLKASCKHYGVDWDDRNHHSALYDAIKAAQLFARLPQVSAAKVKKMLADVCSKR